MIRVVQGFELLTRDAVDWRLLLDMKQMLKINDNQMPDRYFAICRENGYLYLYDKSAEFVDIDPDDEDWDEDKDSIHIGKFTKYSSSKIVSVTINGHEIPVDVHGNLDIPLMDMNRYGVAKPGKGVAAKNGIITLDFDSLDDHAIPYQKINFDGLILDAND